MVDETDLNKARSQTGQAFSILGQAQGAEYKRRRKEMEDYNKKMMRDKFKYGLISAAISPAVQAFGQSATDFAGDLLFGQEEDFFIDTEEGRIAAAKSSINAKNLAALEKTKADIDAEGAKIGSVQKYGTELILKARQEAVSGSSGGADPDGIIADTYIRTPEQQKSAEIEWNKQYKELTDSIKTLKAAPTLAEMQAVRNKTVLGQTRGRRAFGRTLAWLKGKDYDRDIRKPAIQKILTGGIPEQSDEWYNATTEEITNNYLKGANVVEGLDKFTDDLEKSNPEMGEMFRRANEVRKKNRIVVNAIQRQDTDELANQGYTIGEINYVINNVVEGGTALTPSQASNLIKKEMNAYQSAIMPSLSSSDHLQEGVTFFSYEGQDEKQEQLLEEIYSGIYYKANGELPSKSYNELLGERNKNKDEEELLAAVSARFDNVAKQISVAAERLVISDMVENPKEYAFDKNEIAGQRYVHNKKQAFMEAILKSGLASESVDIKDGKLTIPTKLLTGSLKVTTESVEDFADQTTGDTSTATLVSSPAKVTLAGNLLEAGLPTSEAKRAKLAETVTNNTALVIELQRTPKGKAYLKELFDFRSTDFKSSIDNSGEFRKVKDSDATTENKQQALLDNITRGRTLPESSPTESSNVSNKSSLLVQDSEASNSFKEPSVAVKNNRGQKSEDRNETRLSKKMLRKIDKIVEPIQEEDISEEEKVDKIVEGIRSTRNIDALTSNQIYTILGPRTEYYDEKINGKLVERKYERRGFSEDIIAKVMNRLYGDS